MGGGKCFCITIHYIKCLRTEYLGAYLMQKGKRKKKKEKKRKGKSMGSHYTIYKLQCKPFFVMLWGTHFFPNK